MPIVDIHGTSVRTQQVGREVDSFHPPSRTASLSFVVTVAVVPRSDNDRSERDRYEDRVTFSVSKRADRKWRNPRWIVVR